MRISAIALSMVMSLFGASTASADGDPKRGAQEYRNCIDCHALEPGLHLSGPSLGEIIGRMAGKAQGFVRYSSGLKAAGFVWNDAALDGWLKNPEAIIPDTYMIFQGIDDAQARTDLIAFLKIAGKTGGAEKAVADELIPASWLRGNAPLPIRDVPARKRVVAIRHCADSFFIKTQDGRETPHWEKNIRLKIDSVETGPPPGIPVILSAGMRVDRFSVIFFSLADLESFVEEKC